MRRGLVRVDSSDDGRRWRLGSMAVMMVDGVGGERLQEGRQGRHVRQSINRQACKRMGVSRLGPVEQVEGSGSRLGGQKRLMSQELGGSHYWM